MKTLLVTVKHAATAEQTKSATWRAEKIYRFSAEHGQYVVGSSRKASLRLSKTAQPIEGLFEKTDKGWFYHSFVIRDEANARTPIIFDLKKSQNIKVADVIIHAEVVPDISLFSAEEESGKKSGSSDSSGINSKNFRQIILISHHGELLRTHQCEVGATAVVDFYTQKISIKTNPTLKWQTSVEGEFEIRQKSIPRTDNEAFKIPFKDWIPQGKQDRAVIGVMMATFFIGIVASLFAPGTTQFRAEVEPPKSSSPIVLKLSPTQPVPKRKEAAAPNNNKEQNNANSAPASRMDQLKNLASVGKAGLFLKKAVRMPASIGPNGKLSVVAAGVARLDGPTTDFRAMAGSKVSGKVGGGSLSGGTGSGTQLSAGATGNSGVGLLEEEGDVTGGLDKEVIAAFIRKNIGHILYCYERSLSANPNLFGKVAVKFTIGGTGTVETQKIGESTLRNGQVESCILEKISHWKFPEPKGGMKVVVTYPFLFKTTN